MYNPDLGDGRGFLFAQLRESAAAGERLLDLGTKGSGLTPWSRTADGRLTLKGGVREILATEMLESLGVTTSRTFSVIETRGGAWCAATSPRRRARRCSCGSRTGIFGSAVFSGFSRWGRRKILGGCWITSLDRAFAPEERGLERRFDAVGSGRFAHRGPRGLLHGRRIRPWGSQQRQYRHHRRKFRLRSVAIHAPVEPGIHRRLLRSPRRLYSFARQAEAIHWDVAQLAHALQGPADIDALVPILRTFPAIYEERLIARFLWRRGVRCTGRRARRGHSSRRR